MESIVILFFAAAVSLVQGNHLIVSSSQHRHQSTSLNDYLDNPVVNIVSQGMELALKHCQQQFEHEPWNCPVKDFLAKQQQQQRSLDREAAFVQSITVAAIAYTMTKNCSGAAGMKDRSGFCECAFKDKSNVQEVFDCFTHIEGTEQEMTQIISKLSGDQAATDPQGVMQIQNSRAGLFVSISD